MSALLDAPELECEAIAARGAHRATVVWLHGVGQTPQVMADLVRQLELPQRGVRHVFVRAGGSHQSLTGELSRAWFVQKMWTIETAEPEQLELSARSVAQVLAREAAVVGAGRVMLAGFSQGAAMALIACLRYPESLGALVLYAPYAVRQANLRATRHPASLQVPIWMGHGEHDPMIPARHGAWLYEALRNVGHRVSWQTYDCGHVTFGGALDDVRTFLGTALARAGCAPAT